ncbi:MAG: sigma-70 family RNA polymerase sigma factor [Planctomycetota bacterium]|nr:sigma-70 family RNA polymerase sigma factor [Planctomycetota bacterium]
MVDQQPDIKRLADGDEQEWGNVQAEFAGRLLRYISKRVQDHQVREDILQETFLGALRGIHSFNPTYSFEQYLFGICRNRTIDFLRRRTVRGLGGEEEDSVPALERLAVDEATPSQVFGVNDLGARGRDLLGRVLKAWVAETFAAEEWQRIKVVELLLAAEERNLHVAKELDIQDESAVAGIKFRALKRLATLAAAEDQTGKLRDEIVQAISGTHVGIDMAGVWTQSRASCPSRYWWARLAKGRCEPGMADYLEFHRDRIDCPLCQANYEDLKGASENLEPMVARLQASTIVFLRGKGGQG